MGSYGVATQNVFALLDDENEDPQAVAAKLPAAADKKKEVAKPAAKEDQGPSRPPAAGRGGPQQGRGSYGGRGGRAGRGYGRGYGRENGGEVTFDAATAPSEDRGGRGGRGFGRGRGRYGGERGGGRYGEGGRHRKREFDRHDGTGRGYETEKRHGAGKGNWGTNEDEVPAAEPTADTVEEEKPADAPAGENTEPTEEPAAEKAAEQKPVEEEEKVMTLDEYEILLEEKRKNLNKASESGAQVDMSQFKGMKAFARKEEEDEGLELASKKSGKAKADKSRKEKDVPAVEVGFRVGDDTRGRRGGGRGGGRRGEGRGRGRGGRPYAPKIDDASAFPTLGAA